MKRTFRFLLVIAALLCALGVAVYEVGDPLIAMAADYRTPRAETRVITLRDGTVVHLGATSSISASYTADQRRIKVLAGEAWFTVPPIRPGGESRPFVLKTAHGTVTTEGGAEFVVVRYTEAATVFCLRGEVKVSMNHPREGWTPEVTFAGGQLVRYDDEDGLGKVRTSPDADVATAWTRGRLVMVRLTLAEAVARINRYAHGWVYVASDSLEGKQVNGEFDVAHVGVAAQALATQVGAKVMHPLPFLTILY